MNALRFSIIFFAQFINRMENLYKKYVLCIIIDFSSVVYFDVYRIFLFQFNEKFNVLDKDLSSSLGRILVV